LSGIHDQGLVHCEISAENLLINREGLVLVSDPGVSILANQAPPPGSGQPTAEYLAPERAMGKAPTEASDIYSLGVIGYECLTGHVPFSGESKITVALAQVNDAPPPLSESLPKPIRGLVVSMLAKEPENRPRTAMRVVQAADAIRNGDVSAALAAVSVMLLQDWGTEAANASAAYRYGTYRRDGLG